jgi:hypothetical protein
MFVGLVFLLCSSYVGHSCSMCSAVILPVPHVHMSKWYDLNLLIRWYLANVWYDFQLGWILYSTCQGSCQWVYNFQLLPVMDLYILITLHTGSWHLNTEYYSCWWGVSSDITCQTANWLDQDSSPESDTLASPVMYACLITLPPKLTAKETGRLYLGKSLSPR